MTFLQDENCVLTTPTWSGEQPLKSFTEKKKEIVSRLNKKKNFSTHLSLQNLNVQEAVNKSVVWNDFSHSYE